MVDAEFADREFRGRDPIGQHFWPGGKPPERESDWFEIIGVVGHINRLGPGHPSRPQIYYPAAQTIPRSMGFAVRTERETTAIASSLRAALREVADDLSVANVRTMDQLFASNIANQRLAMTLLGAFAALALLLAGVGLYGAVSYSVGQRTREIGVRVAIGGTPRSVAGLVVRQGLGLTGAGLLVGLLASLGLTGLLRSLLFGVTPFDAISFAGGALVLTTIGVLACWIPARRAAQGRSDGGAAMRMNAVRWRRAGVTPAPRTPRPRHFYDAYSRTVKEGRHR